MGCRGVKRRLVTTHSVNGAEVNAMQLATLQVVTTHSGGHNAFSKQHRSRRDATSNATSRSQADAMGMATFGPADMGKMGDKGKQKQ